MSGPFNPTKRKRRRYADDRLYYTLAVNGVCVGNFGSIPLATAYARVHAKDCFWSVFHRKDAKRFGFLPR